jgi:hypothetical protein
MLYIQMTAFAALLLCVPVLADDVSDRAKLLGSWQRQDDSSKGATVWVLEVKGTALHITESRWIPFFHLGQSALVSGTIGQVRGQSAEACRNRTVPRVMEQQHH